MSPDTKRMAKIMGVEPTQVQAWEQSKMTKADDVANPPAFPSHAGDPEMSDPRNRISCGGMTLRDWFAGQALASPNMPSNPDDMARKAYKVADAMLRARSVTLDTGGE